MYNDAINDPCLDTNGAKITGCVKEAKVQEGYRRDKGGMKREVEEGGGYKEAEIWTCYK